LVLYGNGQLEPEQFFGYVVIFSQLITPVRQLTQAYNNVQKGLASADRINAILDAEETIANAQQTEPLKSFSKSIEYKNVSFAYLRGDQGWALRNVDLEIKKGKTIALVGQSGSGKTTLADLLPRFYDATEGEILIDGINIRQANMHELRSLMGLVSQESILFNDTVYNNIAFGVENTTEAQVIEAAKIAHAHEFISEMPDGYQTNIGDRGGKMSGGQRQRIAIARAILKNPPILILDEATSALDTNSERLVQDALNNLMRNRTSIIIAHRLSTIQHADEIIVMQRGEIIERGTHTDLLQQGGTYKKLYDMQAFA
ncbi:MAG: ABC transporter ATP-binding protein, partial [Bacteroidia bacterium]